MSQPACAWGSRLAGGPGEVWQELLWWWEEIVGVALWWQHPDGHGPLAQVGRPLGQPERTVVWGPVDEVDVGNPPHPTQVFSFCLTEWP